MYWDPALSKGDGTIPTAARVSCHQVLAVYSLSRYGSEVYVETRYVFMLSYKLIIWVHMDEP